jgi:L-amino acid N-acyltransferase YncA
MTIRDARPADAEAIGEIYAQGIAERQATFETRPRTPAEIRDWIEGAQRPLLVAEQDGEVTGFARVIAYSEVDAYRGVGEFMIYLAPAARGRGAGRRLLEALCARWEQEGGWKLLAKIFPDNEPSAALCRACGFDEVGVHRRHGQLEGRWRDVVVLERRLGAAQDG